MGVGYYGSLVLMGVIIGGCAVYVLWKVDTRAVGPADLRFALIVVLTSTVVAFLIQRATGADTAWLDPVVFLGFFALGLAIRLGGRR